MQRRGNKSKKVPNVRLRPAGADAMARARASPEQTSWWAADSQIIGSDDTVMIGGSCPRPFKNVIVCATGVLDKPALFKLALELGATSVSAFTDRVTHLVAEDHGGAKYLCALERKIPILLPSWITESHRIWQRGDDVDLAASVAKHRLPVFSGITLCISGVPDIVQRTKINRELTAHGGTYVKALERPVRVTHLLCAGEEETDKMRYAEKFNRAGEADPHIQLVWEEWFWDCLEFGGRFEESPYAARLPRPERRSTQSRAPPDSHSRQHAASANVPSTFDDDADDDELIAPQRLPGMTLQLWGSLLKARGYAVDDARGTVVVSPAKARDIESEMRGEEAPVQQQEHAPSVLSGGSFRRANSMQIDAGPSRGSGPFPRRADSNADVNSNSNTDTATVRGAIEEAGGAVVSQAGKVDADYIVVRLVSGSALYAAETSTSARAQYRTECWLERCILVERLCAPDEHASFAPIGVPLPVPGADRITLSFSGLDVSEACWVRRLLKALGITLAPTFSRRQGSGACLSSGWGGSQRWRGRGGVPGVDEFRVAPGDVVPPVEGGEGKSHSKAKGKDKGKGKADDTMQDITNSYGVSASRSGRRRQWWWVLPPTAAAAARDELRQPDVSLSFGQPNASLGVGRPTTPSPSPSKKLLRRRSTGASPLPLVSHAVPAPTQSSTASSNRTMSSTSNSARAEPSGIRRAATLGGTVKHERVTAAPTARGPTGVLSRARPVLCLTVAALQESIVSLLGKRPAPATPEDAEPVGRAGKRGRAHRTKPQSRQPSDVLPVPVFEDRQLASVFGARRSFSPPDDEGSVLEGLSMGTGADEQSLRVMYEDPGQRAEQRRLASLIGIEPPEGGRADKEEGAEEERTTEWILVEAGCDVLGFSG
ncbi:hypothetical protein B0H14DRAFT_3856655 [Mycena olivaceomarginata]|nr:hypothetical protein B0H14DRAFT_3856655 [Mycena olivaceomarginata]